MNMEILAIRLVAFTLVIVYSTRIGASINSGDVWRVLIATGLGVVAFLISLFLFWVSLIGE